MRLSCLLDSRKRAIERPPPHQSGSTLTPTLCQLTLADSGKRLRNWTRIGVERLFTPNLLHDDWTYPPNTDQNRRLWLAVLVA